MAEPFVKCPTLPSVVSTPTANLHMSAHGEDVASHTLPWRTHKDHARIKCRRMMCRVSKCPDRAFLLIGIIIGFSIVLSYSSVVVVQWSDGQILGQIRRNITYMEDINHTIVQGNS